ncbi:MAG: hypothetical protein F6J93_35690 [Oscillatoria sp. SIO1A7]|nr:hypothetical protein [Oscillatoria sp. SIO1A7]
MTRAVSKRSLNPETRVPVGHTIPRQRSGNSMKFPYTLHPTQEHPTLHPTQEHPKP